MDNTTSNGQHNFQWTTQLTMDNTTYNGQHNLQWTTQLTMDNTTSNGQQNFQWTTQLPMDNTTYNGQHNLQWTTQLTMDNTTYGLTYFQKLPVATLVKKFPTFKVTLTFVAIFRSVGARKYRRKSLSHFGLFLLTALYKIFPCKI